MHSTKSLDRGQERILVRETEGQNLGWISPMELDGSWRGIARTIGPRGLCVDLESVKTAVEGFGTSLGKKLDWVVLRELTAASWPEEKGRVMKLELDSFTPGYAFDEDRIGKIFKDPESIILAIEKEGELLGLAYGGPLERDHFRDLGQVTSDPHYGEGNTFYGASIAISKEYRGGGLGRRLYEEFRNRVKAKTKPDGSSYLFLSGRVKPESSLARIVERDGAELKRIPGGYGKTGEDMAYIVLKLR